MGPLVPLSLGAATLTLVLSASSCGFTTNQREPKPAEPQPAPGRAFLKSALPDPRLRNTLIVPGNSVPADMPMRLNIALKALHEDEFNRRLTAINDLDSPLFGRRLTDEEMKSYARPPSDYEAVEQWLAAYGIRVLTAVRWPVYPIRVEGTAAQIEAALSVRIDRSADGKWFANTLDPQIPANLAGVIAGFTCLDNLGNYGTGPKLICQ